MSKSGLRLSTAVKPLAKNSEFFPALAALIGLGTAFFTFYPGYMSYDSISQLTQARTYVFNDHQPVIMALIWHFLDQNIFRGPAPILFLNGLAFWLALFLILKTFLTRARWRSFFTLLIGFTPPLFVYLGIIWKDVMCGSFMLLAFALWLSAWNTLSKTQFFLGVLCFSLGFLTRYNSPAPGLPLCIFAGIVFGRIFQPTQSSFQRHLTPLLVAMVLLVSLFGAGQALPRLLHAEKVRMWQTILLYDLIGLSIESQTYLLPDYFKKEDPQLDLARMQALYSHEVLDTLFHPYNSDIKNLTLTRDDAKIAALTQSWLAAVFHHPLLHLKNRWAIFKNHLGIARHQVWYPYIRTVEPNDLDVHFTPSRWNSWVHGRIDRSKNSLLFRGWFYLLLTLLITPLFLLRRRAGIPGFWLGLSSLALFLFNFLTLPSSDFRYAWWGVITLPILILMFFAKPPTFLSQGDREVNL